MSAQTPALKAASKYIAKAKTIEKVEPVVAYYCRLYAIQILMRVSSKSREELSFITQLMDLLESSKSVVDGLSRTDAQSRVEEFAFAIFDEADAVDRRGEANKDTALAFHTALICLEVCKQFADPPSELNTERMKYAAWKATDINKALKEGRKPKPGPANEDGGESVDGSDESSSSSSSSSTSSSSSSSSSYPPASSSPAPSSSAPYSSYSLSPSAPAPFSSSSSSPYSASASAPAPTPTPTPTPPAPSSSAPPHPSSSYSSSSSFVHPPAALQPTFSSTHVFTHASSTSGAVSSVSTLPFPFPLSSSGASLLVSPVDVSAARWSRSDAMREGERHMKHALTAIQFDDVNTAVHKMQIALGALLPFCESK